MAFSNVQFDICELAMRRFIILMCLKEMSEDAILHRKWRRARDLARDSHPICDKEDLMIFYLSDLSFLEINSK